VRRLRRLARSARLFASAIATLGAFLFLGLPGVDGAQSRGWCGSAHADSIPATSAAPIVRQAPTPRIASSGAQLVPASLAEARYWGNAPDGAVRATIAGMRILVYGDGALLTATQASAQTSAQARFATEPAWVVALPDRLGGGFLFAVGKAIWRADSWLGPAVPIFASTGSVAEILVGLDRAYVRYPQGSLVAFDPRTGARMDLGSLPSVPHLGRVAAIDGWRAMAIADLEGARITNDAGNSWQPVALAIEPLELVPLPGGAGVAVGGKDKSRRFVWNAVRFDGTVEPLDAPPLRLGTPLATMMGDASPARLGADEGSAGPPTAQSSGQRERVRFRPLLAAVEDGWPVGDGTAVVAHDGAIARVRLADGRVVENVADAFAMKLSRCHAIGLQSPAFAFVCGEPRGETEVFAYDPVRKTVTILGRWDEPREVLSFGNGALAARGPCDSSRTQGLAADEALYCIMTTGTHRDAAREQAQDRRWTELRVRGEQPDRARLAVLADGRALLVRPPSQGDLSTARVTVIDGTRQTTHAIRFPALRADSARVLRYGVWLDGFQERRPGVVGGWIDAAGSVVGIELPAGDDGEARVGEYIRDAGSPIVSGVWGFGWTASRGGFETIDGGMTWTKEIALPEPIAEPVAGRERACGPVGCVVAGWLRIGWGEALTAPPPLPPEPVSAASAVTRGELRLSCELPAIPSAAARSPAAAAASPPAPSEARRGRKAMTPAMWGAVTEFAPFFGASGPILAADDIGFAADASTGFERALHGTPFARVYAWGPRSGEWDALGRWQVRWASAWWPYGSSDGSAAGARASANTRSTSDAPVPWMTLDTARRALGIGPAVPTTWSIAPGDDADHALLVARHNQESPVADVWELESRHPPAEVRPSGADAFPDVQAAARIAGRWVLATAQGSSEAPAAVVWRVDGGAAHEIARIPRAGLDGATRVRFARRSDGRSLGVAVEGQPDLGQPPALWIVPVDSDGGALSEPLAMAPFDVASRAGSPSSAGRSLCTADDVGWEIELPYARTVRATLPTGTSWVLRGAAALARLGVERSCIAAVAGVAEGDEVSADNLYGPASDASATSSPGTMQRPSPRTSAAVLGHGPALTATVQASLLFPQARVSLRCWQR
jgi:hypothetical protein